MKCQICKNRRQTLNFKYLGKLCNSCFSNIILKRARRAINDFGLIKPDSKIKFIDNKGLRGKAAKHLLKAIVKGLPYKETAKDPDIIVSCDTADTISEKFLNQLFKGLIQPNSRVLALLKHITDKELLAYSKIHKISGKLPKKSKLGQKLDKLEERFPGFKFGLVKSWQELL